MDPYHLNLTSRGGGTIRLSRYLRKELVQLVVHLHTAPSASPLVLQTPRRGKNLPPRENVMVYIGTVL